MMQVINTECQTSKACMLSKCGNSARTTDLARTAQFRIRWRHVSMMGLISAWVLPPIFVIFLSMNRMRCRFSSFSMNAVYPVSKQPSCTNNTSIR